MLRALGSAAVLLATLAPSVAVASGDRPLAAEAMPASVAAIVSHVPAGMGRITKAEVGRGLVEQSAQAGRPSPPKPGSPAFEKLRGAAFEERLDLVWIQGQAREMQITATAPEITRELERTKRQNFRDGAEYRDFLQASHFTRRDVRERVEAQLLSTKIQERVLRQGGPRAFREFITTYLKRWRARTLCAPSFLSDRCSNGPESARWRSGSSARFSKLQFQQTSS